MADMNISKPVELTDAELDLVTGGAGQGVANAVGAVGGLAAVAAGVGANIAVTNVANNNEVVKNVFVDVL
jgi:transketolase